MVPGTLPSHLNGMPVGAAYAKPTASASGPSKDCLAGPCFKFTYLFYLHQSCKDGASGLTYGLKKLDC